MWGIGASVGPYIMGAALSSRAGWQTGYRVISVMQMVLTIIILLSLPLWKTKSGANAEEREAVPAEVLTLKQIFRISGVKEVLITFFCYCSLEQMCIRDRYGITEKEFMRAEIEITPAYKSRDVGFDRSMAVSYTHLVGMDFKIRCTGCGREVMLPRAKIEKNIKKVLKPGAAE